MIDERGLRSGAVVEVSSDVIVRIIANDLSKVLELLSMIVSKKSHRAP